MERRRSSSENPPNSNSSSPSRSNLFYKAGLEQEEIDDELINISDPRLEFVEDVHQESPVCRTCRSLSNSLSPSLSSTNSSINSSSLGRTHNGSVLNDHSRSIWYDGGSFDEADVPLLQAEDGILSPSSDDLDHCHSPLGNNIRNKQAQMQLIISSIFCFSFMIAEVIGGYLSNSLAIMTDAAHMLSDFTSFLVSLFALWIGSRSPSQKMSFGYHRAEILGALMSVLIIWILTGVLVYLAINRVIYQDYEIDADAMLIVSGLGVAMNIIMGLVLHSLCNCHTHSHHGHSHSHSHGDKPQQNINVRAALIHVIGDLIQSIGVLIAAYIIKFKPEYHLADPICTFIFSGLVLFTTINIIKDAVHILMEGFPRDLNYATIKTDLQSLEGVKTAHSLHIWSLTLDKNALIVHLAIDDSVDARRVLRLASHLIRQKYRIHHLTVQIEPYDSLMTSCNQCIGPQS